MRVFSMACDSNNLFRDHVETIVGYIFGFDAIVQNEKVASQGDDR
jgi:hypothetical protein